MRKPVMAFVVASLYAMTLVSAAQAHNTWGRSHEHAPDCTVMWYKDRNKPWVRALRAKLLRRGCYLWRENCWRCPSVPPRQCKTTQ